MPRQVDDTRDSGKRQLLSEHHYEYLEQQREAVELANRIRFDQPYRAMGKAHTRHTRFQKALVLEEIEVDADA